MTKPLRKTAPDAGELYPEMQIHIVTEKVTGKFVGVYLRERDAEKFIRSKGAERIHYNIIAYLCS